MKKNGDSMGFTGGAEPTPFVEVSTFQEYGSLNKGKPTFIISGAAVPGYAHAIRLSPQTMRAILAWYDRED